MATVRLDDRRIRALKPRKSTYDIRDRELKGFGVRILPSGAKRYFIHSQHQGQRFWKIVGRAGSVGVDEVRDRARTLVASIRRGSDDEALAPPDTPFETVGDEVFRRYARNWKPSTLRVNRGYDRNQILPWFEGRPLPRPQMPGPLQRRRRAYRHPNPAGRVSRFDAACQSPVDKWTAAPRLTTSPQRQPQQQKRSTHLVHKPVNSDCSREPRRSIRRLKTGMNHTVAKLSVGLSNITKTTLNQRVLGSSPSAPTNLFSGLERHLQRASR